MELCVLWERVDESSVERCRDAVALSYLPLAIVRGSPVPDVPKVPSPVVPWEPKSPCVEVGSDRNRVASDGKSLPDDAPLADMPPPEVDGTMLHGLEIVISQPQLGSEQV